MSVSQLKALAEEALLTCLNCLTPSREGLRLTDPLEGREIMAHYGSTHAAAAFILASRVLEKEEMYAQGTALLEGVLCRWDQMTGMKEFHNDFNLFALCLAWQELSAHSDTDPLRDRIKNAVLNTADSPHDTINWLPMRWYVNRMRFQWTSNAAYQAACDACREKIRAATGRDGLIEDRLPVGRSFSLQYDVSAAALLQLLNLAGEKIDIGPCLGALLRAVAPDGDINYLGRGANQVFAWGPWLYLLSSAGREAELETALRFCTERIITMLKKKNLLLNEDEGALKMGWWDYHHFSVYAAHLALYLVLALRDHNKAPQVPKMAGSDGSSLQIIRQDGYFAAVFAGRSEYLAERGPALAALGTTEGTMIFKGPFGPYGSAFGSGSLPLPVLLNHIGVIGVRAQRSNLMTRLLKHIRPLAPAQARLDLNPAFLPVNVSTDAAGVTITLGKGLTEGFINVPVFAQAADGFRMSAAVDEKSVPLRSVGTIRSAYGEMHLYQTPVMRGRWWAVRIEKEAGGRG